MMFSWAYGIRCPSELTLSRALSEGVGSSLSTHVKTCLRCSKVLHDLQQVRDLSQHLGGHAPSDGQLEQTRTSLLASLQARRRPANIGSHGVAWWRLSAGAAGVALAVAVIVGWRLSPRTTSMTSAVLRTFHASVQPRPGATLNRMGTLTDDIVRLREGGARFDVSPLAQDQRFRVIAGDGEVEVRGTSFDVEVRGDRLAAVRVHHGRVEVRVSGRPMVVLGAREDWNIGESAAPSDTAAPSAAETAFITGWSAFRAGRLSQAVASFDQVLRSAPDSAMAEDAEYWRTVALARSESPAAREELQAFLRKYPRSAHADDARLSLQRLPSITPAAR
jgi:hypothetical protein